MFVQRPAQLLTIRVWPNSPVTSSHTASPQHSPRCLLMHLSTALPICSAEFFLFPKLFLKFQPKHPLNSSARCCARHGAFAPAGAACWHFPALTGKLQGGDPSFPLAAKPIPGHQCRVSFSFVRQHLQSPWACTITPYVVLPTRVLPLSGQNGWNPCCLRKPQASSKRAAVHLSLARYFFGMLPCFSKKK